MSKTVQIITYSQTGQTAAIVRSVIGSLAEDPDIEVRTEVLRPRPPFPFPWTADSFFQAFPESVRGIPCELEPLSLPPEPDADLVIIAYQPWFLSPSIPFHAFFQNSRSRELISGRPVVTIIGCRNMWVTAQRRVRQYIDEAGGIAAGNIVLRDRAPNLRSVGTVIRWMFSGKKEGGVSEADIRSASRFGDIIRESLLSADFSTLRRKLADAGATEVVPQLAMMERRAAVFFRLWADIILKKGPYGSPQRLTRVRMFKYYLLFVIFVVSPLVVPFFRMTLPFRKTAVLKEKNEVQSL